MKKIIILFAFFVFLGSCTNSEYYEKISGDWECTSWINKSKGIDKCKNNVHFEFQQDKSYYSKLGNVKDSGNFKILNNMLYITPKGKMEFVVKITKLNKDTLVFLMNQAGEEEILTLIRMKQ